MARDGRRRRVLNDELLHGAGAHAAARGAEEAADAPRYGEQANIENHPQVSDFVPRKRRGVLVALGVGLSVAAATQTVAHFAEPIAAVVPGASAATVGEQFAGGISRWTAAVMLLLVTLASRLIYSLRKHRVDDYAGQYRVWRRLGRAATVLSVNSVVGFHTIFAATCVAATGWSLTASGAEWWLAPLALFGIWTALPLVREVAEYRGAMLLAVPAAACYGIGMATALGWAPTSLGAWSESVFGAAPLAGHTFALAAALVFARYVVLDVQGLIDHKPVRKAPRNQEKAAASGAPEQAESRPASVPMTRPASSPAASFRQADVDDEDEDEENEVDVQTLSKAERKRLRKMERQNRAA